MKRFLVVCCLFFLFILAIPVHADQMYGWQVFETEHFVIFYPTGYDFQARETAYYLEKNLPRINATTGNENPAKYRIIIQDVGIETNGETDMINTKIDLFTNAPLPGTDLSSFQSWYRLVSGHELTHMRQVTNYSEEGKVLPEIMGNLFAPNLSVPGWLIEGITVYSESQINPYEGRLNDGYYDAIVAAKAQAKDMPNILEASYFHQHYPIGQWYTYGGVFVRYLANTYGQDKLAEFFKVHGTNLFGFMASVAPSLTLDNAAKKVYGKTWPQLFSEWVKAEIEEHRDWKTDADELLSKSNRGDIFNLTPYNNRLYYVQSEIATPEAGSYGRVSKLMEYDPATRTSRVLKIVENISDAKMQIADNKIYYLCGENSWGYANTYQSGFGLTNVLYSYDLISGEVRKLFTDDMRAFEVNADGEVIYIKDRKDMVGSQVWKYSGNRRMELGKTVQSIAQIETYDTNKYVIVSKTNLGSWNISFMNLQNLLITPIIETPWSEIFVTVEGKKLYYTGNYNHEYALFEYDLEKQLTSRLTAGGFASGGVFINGEMYFSGITAEGAALFRKTYTPTAFTLPEREKIIDEPIGQFAETLKPGKLLVKDLTYLLNPGMRILPVLVRGEDGLGLGSYMVSYSPYVGLDFMLETTAAMPLQVYLSSELVNEKRKRETVVGLNYPLFQSTQNIITDLSLNCYTNFKDESVIGLNVGLYERPHRVNAFIQGNVSNDGLNCDVQYQLSLHNSRVTVKTSAFNKFNKGLTLRGLDAIYLPKATGVSLAADYTHKLCEVRNGLWGSNLFLGDIYGGVYFDATTADSGHIIGGGKLNFDLGMASSFSVVPEVGLGFDGKKLRPFFGISTNF